MISLGIKVLAIAAVFIAIAAVIGLFVMAGVAGSHDVVRIPVPPSSFIATTLPTSDYADAYIAPMPYSTYGTIDQVVENAFEKGAREIYRDDAEVAYEGTSPGLRYTISYILVRDTQPPSLAVATTVRILEKKGRYYLVLVRPIHRRILPYMLDRMAHAAPN